MKPFLRNIREIQDIVWDDSYRWDIKIPDAPSPFNKWFPAAQVEIGEAISNVHTFEVGQTEFSIPKMMGQRTLTITFYDNVDRALLSWIRDWIVKEIHNEGKGVTPVLDVVKPVEIVHLDENENLLEHRRFDVIPSGTLSTTLTSTPELQTRSLEFIIINEV